MSKQKEENFIRLAENRTNKILDMIRLLGNLSNTSNYTYSKEQVDKIFGAIEKELSGFQRLLTSSRRAGMPDT
jgi:hypothetical protein